MSNKPDKKLLAIYGAMGLALLIAILGIVNHFSGNDEGEEVVKSQGFQAPTDGEQEQSFGSLADEYESELEEEKKEKNRRETKLDDFDKYSLNIDDDELDFENEEGKKDATRSLNIKEESPKRRASPKRKTSNRKYVSKNNVKVDNTNEPTEKDEERTRRGFNSATLREEEPSAEEKGMIISQWVNAVIEGQQSANKDRSLKIRLKQSLTINGNTLPANTILYGYVVGMSGTRMKVNVSGSGIAEPIPVYDAKDNVEGIAYVINRNVDKVNATPGNISFSTPIASFTTNAGSGGKVKSVTLPDQYKILIPQK